MNAMTTQKEPIRGKIAKVLNSREVALNVGAEQGVSPGMRFRILSGAGDEIRDPDSGAVLGCVQQPKAMVQVRYAEKKFAIAATYRSKEVNVGGKGLTSAWFGSTFESPKWETRYETLKAGGGFEPATEELDEKDSFVTTGDPVVQVIDTGEGNNRRRL